MPYLLKKPRTPYSRKKWAVTKRKNAAVMQMLLDMMNNLGVRGDSTLSGESTLSADTSVVIDIEAELKKTKDIARKKALAWVKLIKGWNTTRRVVTKNGQSFTVTASLSPNARSMVVQKLYFRGPVPRVPNKKPYWRSIRRSKRIGKTRVYYDESQMNRNTWSLKFIQPWDGVSESNGFLRTRWSNKPDAWMKRWERKRAQATK